MITSTIKFLMDVQCPHCDSLTEIEYGDNMPGVQNGCLTRCDVCDEPFCLLPEHMCDGCRDWYECAVYSFVDVIATLIKDKLVIYNVETKRISVK